MTGAIRVGCGVWRNKDWEGSLYLKGSDPGHLPEPVCQCTQRRGMSQHVSQSAEGRNDSELESQSIFGLQILLQSAEARHPYQAPQERR